MAHQFIHLLSGVCCLQAAAKLASGLVSTVWHVVDDMVVTPALQVGLSLGGGDRSLRYVLPGAGLQPLAGCVCWVWGGGRC
jgi:hypothetical protein